MNAILAVPAAPAAERLRLSLATERVEHARLQIELALCTSALDAASTHFMILDVSRSPYRIVYVNRAVCESHGYSPTELIGQSPEMLVCEEGSREALKQIEEAVCEVGAVSVELVGQRRDRSTFAVGVKMMPLPASVPGVTHYVCIGADITSRLAQDRAQRDLQERLIAEMRERERMATELRLAQKLESVGRLAAGIAHEINTPIQYVGDSLSFLQSAAADLQNLRDEYRRAIKRLAAREPAEDVLSPVESLEAAIDLEFMATEIPKAFQRTLEGVERVAAIVRAMKEFAHPHGTDHSCADLNRAIETTLAVARNEYKYCAQVETRFGAMPEVRCNVGELNQVFLNLIVNAAHAVDESGKDACTGRITVVTSASTDTVSIAIGDNGCGIASENLEKIFDPFFTTKPVGRGTGQGLAIARSIVVEKHGGRIDVESTVGKGTTFTVHLPIAGRGSPRPS
jgi:PAS domain S-box-containing protein